MVSHSYLNFHTISCLDRNPWTSHLILQEFSRSSSRCNRSKPIITCQKSDLGLKVIIKIKLTFTKQGLKKIEDIKIYLHGTTMPCSQATRLWPSVASVILSTFELRYETPDSTHLEEINIDYTPLKNSNSTSNGMIKMKIMIKAIIENTNTRSL